MNVWVPFQVEPPRRGQWVRTAGGGEGLYVGTTPNGTPCVCYLPERFDRMVERFEARHGSR